MSSNDELITNFLAVTGATDPSTATQYVEMAGGNLDMAISLYMEHNTSGGGGGGPSSAAGAASMMEEDQIRAPDQTRTMRLFDETAGGGAYSMVDPSVRMMQEMMEEQLARSAFAAPPPAARDAVDAAAAAANNDEDDGGNDNEMTNNADDYQYDDDSDDDYEMDDAETSGPPAAPTLQDMFSPPSHIMHKAGGFQGARQMAKDSKRWLLVNIQKDAEFSSHALNRDVWRNDLVENLIQEGFIFWQEMDISVEGTQYVQRYKVENFPHIAIVDPRTGRLLWKKEGWTQQNAVTAETFAEMAMDFCSRNSLEKPPVAPLPKGKAGSSGASQTPVTQSHQMSEQEQIEAAVNASLQSIAPTTPPSSTPAPAEAMEDDSKPAAQDSPLKGWLDKEVGSEPATGARLQFRMPDGKRLVRKFQPDDTVETIFAFVAQTLIEGQDPSSITKSLKLMAGFPPKDLISDIFKTIKECSLSGEAVSVRWVD